MKHGGRCQIVFLFISALLVMVLLSDFNHKNIHNSMMLINPSPELTIATVICGKVYLQMALSLVKSAIVFSKPKQRIKFVLFTEISLQKKLKENLEYFMKMRSFSYVIKNDSYPEEANHKEQNLRYLFKQCATLKLFLPSLLPEDDAVLFVDSDCAFLSPPKEQKQRERVKAFTMTILSLNLIIHILAMLV